MWVAKISPCIISAKHILIFYFCDL